MVLDIQWLTMPNAALPAPNLDTMVDLVTALGYVQIDTLHVVNRAHYVTLWARVGAYTIDDFHKLIYTAGQRRLYEGWGHAVASYRWRIAFCSGVRLAAWRGDKRQRRDATWY
jgi:uncharacterized protein YcaQ